MRIPRPARIPFVHIRIPIYVKSSLRNRRLYQTFVLSPCLLSCLFLGFSSHDFTKSNPAILFRYNFQLAGAEDEDPIPNLPTPERSPYPESWNSDEEDGDSEEEEEEDDDDDENEEDSDLDNLEAKELANAEAATQAIRDKIAKRKGEAGGSDSSPSKKSKTDSSTEGGLVKVKREPDNRDLGEMVLIDSDDEM